MIWTLKMPPTVVIDARHPLLLEKEMLLLVWDPVAVIGRTSLPTLGGVCWHSVPLPVVVDVVDVVDVFVMVVVDVIVVVNVVVESAGCICNGVEPLPLVVGALAEAEDGTPVAPVVEDDWFCAYAAIPPEIRTSIAATVSIWSLPALTCMLLRVCCPHDSI